MVKRKYSSEPILSYHYSCETCKNAESMHCYHEPSTPIYKMDDNKSFMITNRELNLKTTSFLTVDAVYGKKGTIKESVVCTHITPDIGDRVLIGAFWPMKIAPFTTMSPCAMGIVCGPLNGRGIYATVPVHVIYDMHGTLEEKKSYEIGLGNIRFVTRHDVEWPMPQNVWEEQTYPEYSKKREKK